jgi:hypothetical protein
MSLSDEIRSKVNDYMTSRYEVVDARVVPGKPDVRFGPHAKKLWARAIYIDLRNSRTLLAEHTNLIAARVHKSFLYAALRHEAWGGALLRVA